MQLLIPQSPKTLANTLLFDTQLQTRDLQPSSLSTQRRQLSIVWEKKFDGKRERMVAYWVIDQ